MGRGGARPFSGPAPDPYALRRDRPSDKDSWTTLPAEGRQGPPPKWPLNTDVSITAALNLAENEHEDLVVKIEDGNEPRGAHAKLAKLEQRIAELRMKIKVATDLEAEIWTQLWSTPQAIVWDKLLWTREVAVYVRWQVQAELGDMDAAKEARQWSNLLGLNPTACLKNRWKVAPAAKPEEPARPTPRKRAAKKEPGSGPVAQSVKGRMKVINGGAA